MISCAGSPAKRANIPMPAPDLALAMGVVSDPTEKGFQSKTLMQGSSLHECFTITSEDHAV